MGENKPGGKISSIPASERSPHYPNGSVLDSQPKLTFGNPDLIQPIGRKKSSTLKPGDIVPDNLGFDIDPSEIVDLKPNSPSTSEIRLLEKSGVIPKIRTFSRNRLMLSTPDINNPDARTVLSPNFPIKIRLISKWGRDTETGLLYAQAQFEQFYRDGIDATPEQKTQDQASFLKQYYDFFHPENGSPNEAGIFNVAVRPGKGPGSGWISSIFD